MKKIENKKKAEIKVQFIIQRQREFRFFGCVNSSSSRIYYTHSEFSFCYISLISGSQKRKEKNNAFHQELSAIFLKTNIQIQRIQQKREKKTFLARQYMYSPSMIIFSLKHISNIDVVCCCCCFFDTYLLVLQMISRFII